MTVLYSILDKMGVSMYKGFNLEYNDANQDLILNTNLILNIDPTLNIDRKLVLFKINQIINKINNNRQITDRLDYFSNEIMAEDIIHNWFQGIKADVFISHSHKDNLLAKKLSIWLWKNFRLRSFIDSTVWGYGNNLIHNLTQNGFQNPYNHVHMILSIALSQMIDKCECLFFLNTPNSVSTKDMRERTYSPWLYYELGISKLIEKKKPERMDESTQYYAREDFAISYNLDMSHLCLLNASNLIDWDRSQDNEGSQSLDYLYKQNKIRG